MGILCSCLSSEEDYVFNDRSLIKHERNYKLTNYRSRCIPLKAWNAKFLYTIIKWRTEWMDDNSQNPTTKTILGSEYKLISTSSYYNDLNHYNRTMEALMVLELFHSLQKDKDDDPDYNYNYRSLDCIVEKCETKVIDQIFDFKKLTINVIMEKDGKYNYPLIGDLLKVRCANQQEVFGYVENIEKFRQIPSQSTKNVFTVLIENIIIEPKKITITTVKSMHINLRMLLALHDLSKSHFLPLILKPNHDDYSTLEANTDTILPLMLEQPLNYSQMKIVANVVNTVNNRTPKICLINGPPGTGKSTVIISIISEIMKKKFNNNNNNNNMRILLCSSSNFAVDAVLIKLLSSLENNGIKLNIVRIGRNDKIDEKVKSRLPSLPIKITAEDHKLEKESIFKADIIAATLGSCYSNKMEQLFSRNGDQQIQVCIIDEAGQATEIETLIPLMLGVKLVVLVGDPQQLPPTIISQAAEAKGMGKSLFARAQKCFEESQNNFLINPIQSLNIQYRMEDEIAAWPNTVFYHDRILNAANNMSLKKQHHYKVLSHRYPQSDTDRNECELEIIINLLEVIITEFVANLEAQVINEFPSIGIITPYSDQKKLIENMINKKSSCNFKNINVYNQLKEIEINTLDSFQGKEKDIIIMSCTRTKKLGFLNSPNRLNVCLTRAKQTMIVYGNFESPIYQNNQMWKNMINNAKQRGCFNEVNQNMNYKSLKNLIFY